MRSTSRPKYVWPLLRKTARYRAAPNVGSAKSHQRTAKRTATKRRTPTVTRRIRAPIPRIGVRLASARRARARRRGGRGRWIRRRRRTRLAGLERLDAVHDRRVVPQVLDEEHRTRRHDHRLTRSVRLA